VNIFRSAGKQT